jgi:Phage integrase, N-terminal SAM-like domain
MTDEAISPLRRRMIEDMTIRKFTPKTQHDYVQRIKNFTAFLGRSPDTATFADVRRYQLHLVAKGLGVPTLNQTVATHGAAHARVRFRMLRLDWIGPATKNIAKMVTSRNIATLHLTSALETAP